jgi:hypothetical protein
MREAAIQQAVFAHLRMRAAPGVFAFHPANGGYRRPVGACCVAARGEQRLLIGYSSVAISGRGAYAPKALGLAL